MHGRRVLSKVGRGAITAENLTYFLPNAMPGSEAVIKRMNFDIKAGECLGIVGPSGAGKSTLARLLVGAIRPSQGSVAYDSADIGQWLDADRGRHVGYLGQEIEFFPGTIAQNIARFEPGFSDEDVIRAARKAGAHDLIVGRIKGYSTELGPNGERLSGGERQRLALARAFYGKPAILVLDEPNSNLDKEGETALETAIRGAKADGRTVIIITHRPSIAPLCDRLMVMRQGMIDMMTAHDEIPMLRYSLQGNTSRHQLVCRNHRITISEINLVLAAARLRMGFIHRNAQFTQRREHITTHSLGWLIGEVKISGCILGSLESRFAIFIREENKEFQFQARIIVEAHFLGH